jgi:hypothetical protein
MALSATFTANFASFYAAVDKADAVLKDFGDGASKVGGRLNALSNQFSGVKIVQEATIMAKAVEEIGGVSKLTEKELARLGTTANEAVAKMKALGMDVPQNLQAIADKTKTAEKATIDWKESLTKIAGAVGIAFSIDAIRGFIGSVFDAAGAVKDLSDQWGVSTKAVQQWSAAASASGIEAETLGKSIQFFTESLSESSAEYAALLANVGLSADKLRGMKLEDAYKEVARAIAGVKDETLQLDIAQGLLGPSAKKMIGGIRDGLFEAADAQAYMSDETIKRLDDAGDAWLKFKNLVVIYSGEMLASVMESTKRLTSSWGNFFKYMAAAAGDAFGGTSLTASLMATDKALDDYKGSLKGTVTTTETYTVAGQKLESGLKNTALVTADLKAKTDALKASQEARAKALEAAKKIEEDYAQAVRDHGAAVDDLAEAFAGGDVIGKAKDYLEALERSVPIEQMTAAKKADINKVMSEAIDAYEALGSLAPDVMYDIWLATAKADEGILAMIKNVQDLPTVFQEATKVPIDLSAFGTTATLGAAPSMFVNLGHDLAGVLSQSVLKAIQGGGDLFQAAGSAVGNFLLDPKQSGVGKAIEGAAKKLPGLMGSAISSAIPVVGAFIGPAIGWLSDKISGWFGKKEYEKLRDGFIQSAGGIQALTEAAKDAGIRLDELMRARNTDQVKAAIGTIEEAFKFQASALDQAIEAATRYGFTIEELGPALQRQELDKQAQQLYKDWQILNSAGIDTIAITERMADSVNQYVQDAMKMGLEIPQAMRPMLETMAKSGQLLDENGEAITNLDDAGLSFAMTMSDGFKALIEQVKQLTDAISRSLGLAIKNVPDLVVKGRVVYEDSEPPTPKSREPLESYQGGTDGFRNFGTGTPVMLHGWEAVVPRDESSGAFATVAAAAPLASSAAASTSIVINAQGAFFDTPGDLQRLADRVNDALTAKFGLRNAMRAG